jgi:acetylornithine deacetylase/succinyl-diaminopimelate desuccinylase-like protein
VQSAVTRQDADQLKAKARSLMPEIIADLGRLVGHASVAFPGFPSEPVNAMANEVKEMFTRAGVPNVRLLDLGAGYKTVYADVPGPAGSPTVLMYAHYDVQPAPMDAGWKTDPWTMTEKDGRLYGRGVADDKSGVMIHALTMRLLDGKLPVGLKLVIEGEEETLSHLEEFVAANSELFKADVMIIGDMGNMVAGEPVLTSMLRGHVQCIVETRTFDHPLHSGVFGGAAPDALVALIRILDGLWDERGNTIVPDLHSFEWDGADYPEQAFRETAALLPGVEIIGDGSVGTKLWSKPNATVIGLDAPKVAEAGNVLLPTARAKVAMRVAPGADPEAELAKLMDFLRARAPWGVNVEVTRVKASDPFLVDMNTPAVSEMRAALKETYGREVSTIGSGGSIPLLETLAKASPGAEFILTGAEDAIANIHGANESVDPTEIEKMAVAEALFISNLATRA